MSIQHMSHPSCNPTILIIDDSRVNVALMKHIFKEYNIVAVHNGLEAMDVAKAEPRPDLILLDVMVPGIDGYEVCRRLKQDALTGDIPVVFITTQIEAENIIKGFEAGAIDYIPKPFKIPELQARVRTQITVKQSKDQNERLRKRIEEINKQLTDSIVYAEKIQSASFPKREYLNKVMPEHFVMLKPRDIVSGDFYWVTKKGGKIVVAAVDCTGHGVPGAIMSVFGITFLRAIVEIGKQTTPSVILDEMRRLVIDALQQEADSEIKDGMDMSVVTIDINTSTFEYAGAFNPAYIVRNGELIILPADSMPVSIGEIDRAFTNHSFTYKKGDCLYLFSDGFASQFGGPKNKKVKQSGFKQLLVANAHLPMHEQHTVYDQFFTSWMGTNDQIDDVLLMGVKL
jgi:sigma-B regulation protein RsbU (phosphoserine phosphatase)